MKEEKDELVVSSSWYRRTDTAPPQTWPAGVTRGRTWQTGPCSGILRQGAVLNEMWDTFSHSTDSPLDMMLQLSLRCLKKKFTSHHLRPEIPVPEGGPGGQNEHIPFEYVMAPDKIFDFTLHLSSSAYLHIHAFLQIQYYSHLMQQEKIIHWKRPEGTVCQPQLSFSRTRIFQCAQDFACHGSGVICCRDTKLGNSLLLL